MSPAGYEHGLVAQRLAEILSAFVRKRGLGFVPTAETGFMLRREPDTVRAPDVAFVSKARHKRVGEGRHLARNRLPDGVGHRSHEADCDRPSAWTTNPGDRVVGHAHRRNGGTRFQREAR
jgi:hypothetical protein